MASGATLQLLTPDGQTVRVPSFAEYVAEHGGGGSGEKKKSASREGGVWRTLGRNEYGIPPTENLVSRAAAEIRIRPGTDPNAASRLFIYVLGRNPLHLQEAAPVGGKPSSPHAIPRQTEVEWPRGATLFLLHTPGRALQYPFTLREVPNEQELQPISLSLFDPEATQDASGMPSQHPPVVSAAYASPKIRVKVEPPSLGASPGDAPLLPFAAPAEHEKESLRTPGTVAAGRTSSPSLASRLAAVASPMPYTEASLVLPATASEFPVTTASQIPATSSELQEQARRERQTHARLDHAEQLRTAEMERRARKRSHAETENDQQQHSAATAAAAPSVIAAESAAAPTSPQPQTPQPPSTTDADAMLQHLPDEDFAFDDVDPVQDYVFAPASPRLGGTGPSGAAAAAALTLADAALVEVADPIVDAAVPSPAKKPRMAHVIEIKRSLDFLDKPSSLASSSTTVAPAPILNGYAVYLLSEGIGARQLEILHANIVKRGGILLATGAMADFPKHKYHTVVVDKDAKRREKRRLQEIERKQGAEAAATAAAESKIKGIGEKKLTILFLVAASIRTKAALLDILQARVKRQAVADAARQKHRLGVPSAKAGALSPPSSPNHTSSPPGSGGNSPTASVASTSSASASSSVKLRSSWQIHHVDWLVESFKRNALLPPDAFLLDDMDPHRALASANSAASFTSGPPSVASGATSASAATSRTAAARQLEYSSSPSAAGAAAAADGENPNATDAVLAVMNDAVEDGDGDGDGTDLKYDDDGELATMAAVTAWNNAIAAQLRETADKYNAQAGEHFRAYSFRRAAGVISSLDYPLKDAQSIADVKGIGPSIIAEVESILRTGHSARLDTLQKDPVLRVHQLLQTVHGIGPKTAEKLYNQGVRTIDDLRVRASKLTAQQQTYLRYYDELRDPIPRGEVGIFEKLINSVLHQIDPQLQMTVCGSFRRGKATCGDIDCLITHPDPTWQYHDASMPRTAAAAASGPAQPSFAWLANNTSKSSVAYLLEEIIRRLHAIDLLTDDLVLPSNKQRYKAVKNIYESQYVNEMYCGIGRIPYDAAHVWGGKHRRIDLKIYHVSEIPFAILYFTGSKDFNRYMRLYCNQVHGYSLSDKALSPYQRKGKDKIVSGISIPCKTEQDIFAAIGCEYIPPTERDRVPNVFLSATKL